MASPSFPAIPGAPAAELRRSAAARAVARMAAASGLRLSHFERRFALELPEHWCVPDLDLGPYPWSSEGGWRGGGLPETKFRTFRLDRRIGSFHPSHGPKWTAHELCHGLIGFGWRPGADVLWHATAARLAELVPVALWYFFDEAGLVRCPRHAGGGALFAGTCAECDRLAARDAGVDAGPDVDRWRRLGRAYVEAEIDAAWRTLTHGIPVSNRYGTLDLCTDGLAYVRAHRPVLESPAFGDWVDAFCGPNQGHHDDLESLVARVREVVDALCGEGDAPPLAGHGPLWAVQDVGWRLIQLCEDVEGEALDALEDMTRRLAAASQGSAAACSAALSDVVEQYETLVAEVVLPPTEELFGVGYPVANGYGIALRQLVEGVRSALPLTAELLGHDLERVVGDWAAEDADVREGIGDRFAGWLRANDGGIAADQAALEAALCYVDAPDAALWALRGAPAAGDRWVRPEHVRLVRVQFDVSADPSTPPTGVPLDSPVTLAVVRALDGEREVLALSEVQADRLDAAAAPGLRIAEIDDEVAALMDAGLLRPVAWQTSEG